MRNINIKIFLSSLCFCSFFSSQTYAQSIPNEDLCATAALEAEKILQIPAFLLQAISLTESGRWHKASSRLKPWPWAVGAQKKSHYFSSKKEAVSFVDSLIKKGVTNIDMGCMQINWHYHGETFNSLDEAFNPVNNVAYAGIFLSELHQMKSSWNQAVKYYHSANPKFNRRYIKAVFSNWKKLKDQSDELNEPMQIGIQNDVAIVLETLIPEEDNTLLRDSTEEREAQTILQSTKVKLKQEKTLLNTVIRYDAFARVKASQRIKREFALDSKDVPPPILQPSELLKSLPE